MNLVTHTLILCILGNSHQLVVHKMWSAVSAIIACFLRSGCHNYRMILYHHCLTSDLELSYGQINGNDLREVKHQTAVGFFHSSGDFVKLLVERGAELRISVSTVL